MKATIHDVAKLANVSMSTVSHVINGTRNVNEDTARKVRDAIEKTGYIPNIIAKSLKQSSTNTIGVVITDIRNQFFVDVIHAIDEEARKDGLQVFISETEENGQREFKIIKALCERRVDGIIYSPTIGMEKQTIEYLKRVKIPVIMIDRVIGRDFDWVGVESRESTREITEYLTDLGHKKIGILAGFRGINTTEERVAGYQEAMAKAGLPVEEQWVISGNYRNEPVTEKVIRVMESPCAPTAWIAANNRMIYNAMAAMQQLNLNVPEQVSLAAFGYSEWAEYFEPKLTALREPCWEMGKQAYQLLKRRMEDMDAPVQQIRLMPKLEIRNSCKTLDKTSNRK